MMSSIFSDSLLNNLLESKLRNMWISNWLNIFLRKRKNNFVLFYIVITIIVLAIIVSLTYYTIPKNNIVNLLLPKDWIHLSNAKITDIGVNIIPTGSEISHKDTSTPQANPLVNVLSSHLKASGDFQIMAKMLGIENGATLQLYGQVPIIYDEWRQERGSLRVTVNSEGLIVQIWDGTSASSIDERIYKSTLKKDASVILTHKADKIIIQVDSKILGSMPDHNIFANGTIWFGVDANKGTSGWTLSSLYARGINRGQVELISLPSLIENHNQTGSLRNLALANPRHLPIGTAVSLYPILTDEAYKKTVLEQFSIITPENSMKPQSIHPQKNLYTFQDADAIVEIALKNQILVHGHVLVLGKANPKWMEQTPKNERKQAMIDHINSLVSHFKGKVAEWDVINEPLSEDDIDYTNGSLGIRKQIWSDAMGEDYIDTAFRTAHAADPTSKLYINDYGLEKDGMRWDALLALVQRLKARGVPIDGVGFESHVYKDSDAINPEILKQHIQVLAGLGIDSRISEIDVLGDDPNFQAKQYGDILMTCLSEPTCTSYTTWGITDLYGSTTLSDRYPIKLGDSLLWSHDYIPKSSVTSIKNILKR